MKTIQNEPKSSYIPVLTMFFCNIVILKNELSDFEQEDRNKTELSYE